MKHHIVVKLRRELEAGLECRTGRTSSTTSRSCASSSSRASTASCARPALAFWVTREYEPASQTWNADEHRLGLNRTYRLILQEDYGLPAGLVEQIRLLPAVEDAHGSRSRAAPLPDADGGDAGVGRHQPARAHYLRTRRPSRRDAGRARRRARHRRRPRAPGAPRQDRRRRRLRQPRGAGHHRLHRRHHGLRRGARGRGRSRHARRRASSAPAGSRWTRASPRSAASWPCGCWPR